MQIKSERGSARLKFLVVVVVIAAVAYAGYLYVPVAYNAYLFKDLMQQKANAAVGLGHPPTWVKEQLDKSAPDYNIPTDLEITSAVQDKRIEVRAQYSQPIQFPGYTYLYNFDHTVKSTDFLLK
ncbi:MAG TPA: hypothetical protein VEW46_17980 [Pyrinomonadaceae bacterium]|nr:hypothetical protein [Pyrinomonadaceae bacterium]